MKKHLFLFLFAVALIPVGVVFGQSSSANFVTQRFVVGAGDVAASTTFKVTSVIGQASTDLTSSSNFKLSGGFLAPNITIPTSVDLATSTAQSFLPFWILIAAALTLLVASFLISRRARTHHRP